MHFKRLSILAASAAMLLVSCGNGSIYSTYSFRMGKKSGTNFSFEMKLDENKYTPSSVSVSVPEKSHTFTLDISARSTSPFISISLPTVSTSVSAAKTANDSENGADDIETLFANWTGYTNNPQYADSTSTNTSTSTKLYDLNITLGGAYEMSDEPIDGRYTMKFDIYNVLGIELPEIIQELINKNLDKLFYAYMQDKSVSIVIPVSLNDLQKQIKWLEDESHRGTMPPEDSDLYYHTVTISLTRD